MQKLQGLIAAPHTPFASNGEVNLDVINQQADLFVQQGVKGVYICGTTGEGLSMSVAERKAATERWVEAAAGRLSITVHVGALSITDTVELAKHANGLDIFATSAIAPCFFKPGSVAGLIEYCKHITDAAPDKPFYYYNSPGMSGVNVDMKAFLEEGIKVMPNLAGIKFNCADLYQYQRALHADGDFDVPFGVDEAYASALPLGAQGAVGSTYNYMAPLFLKIDAAFAANDMAEVARLQYKCVELVDILVEFGGVAAGKAIMAMHGLDVGDPRTPISSLTAAQKAVIIERVEKLGVVEK